MCRYYITVTPSTRILEELRHQSYNQQLAVTTVELDGITSKYYIILRNKLKLEFSWIGESDTFK